MLLCHKLNSSLSNTFSYSELCTCTLEVKSYAGTILEWLKNWQNLFHISQEAVLVKPSESGWS